MHCVRVCVSSPGYHTHFFEFTGVSNCWDVVHLHRLLWSNVVLNVLGVFLGIITAAILGAFKDLVRLDTDPELSSVYEDDGFVCPMCITPVKDNFAHPSFLGNGSEHRAGHYNRQG